MPSPRATCINLLGVVAGSVGLAIAALGAGAGADPLVSLALRGVAARTIEVGEPLFVAVRIDPPPGQSAFQAPQPAQGSWRDATTVELVRATGGIAVARGRALSNQGETGSALDDEGTLLGSWWFAAEDMNRLAAGSYRVRAVFQRREGAGWKGEAIAEPIPVEVVVASGLPERGRQKTISLALAAAAEGTPRNAVEILDAALRQDPNAIPVLVIRAQVALGVGDVRAASICLRRARALGAQKKGKPSIVVHELAIRVDQAMADPTVRDAPSAWAQLPPGVLEPVIPDGPAPRPAPLPGTPTPLVPQRQPGIPVSGASGPTVAVQPGVTPLLGQTVAIPSAKAAAVPPASETPASRAAGVLVPPAESDDTKIRTDPAGQWATSATAGSQYGKNQYSPAQATGAPNVTVAGNSPDAWCPANKTSGTDWLEVTFARPVHATEVRVRQNDAPGAVAQIEALEPNGTSHVWWAGVDPVVAPATRDIVWFAVRVPKTDYLVAKVKITLNLASGPGWKEIDAVQLVGTGE